LTPRVTVLTPTYNRPEYLPEAIRSVVAQQFTDWEMLVINDGGVDVRAAVEAVGDERVRYLNRDRNCGKAACLNVGLEEARGEYVAYLDDDDFWYPTHLAALVRALDGDPDVGAAYSDLYKVFMARDQEGRRFPLEKRVDVCRDFNRLFMFYFNHTLHVSLMHRRDLALRVGGYDEDVRVLIDWDLTRKLCFYTDFHHVQAVTGEYCVPITRSDRISEVQRLDPESFLHNKRRVRADLPPEPWPKVQRVAVVLPLKRWDEGELEVVRCLLDRLDYPCRMVLVDCAGDRDGASCRAALGPLAELRNVRVVPAGDCPLRDAYRAGVESVDADYYYLPSEHLRRDVELRLIQAVPYLNGNDCAGVRWDADGAEGRPYDVVLTREAVLPALAGDPDDVRGVHTLAEDWIPEAFEADYLMHFAAACELEGNYRAARELLERAARLERGAACNAYLVQQAARIAFAVGDLDPAEQMCRGLIQAGYEADNWVRLGQICQRKGDTGAAADAYRRGLDLIGLRDEDVYGDAFPIAGDVDLDAFRATAGLGECLLELGRPGEAAEALRKATRLRANSGRPHAALGRMLLDAGEPDRAEGAFVEAARREESGVPAAVSAGLAQARGLRGDRAGALRHWRDALAAEPDNAGYLAGVVEAGRDIVPARELEALYRAFLARRPGHVGAIIGLATLCLACGRAEEAADLVGGALLLEPAHVEARRVLSAARRALRVQGRARA